MYTVSKVLVLVLIYNLQYSPVANLHLLWSFAFSFCALCSFGSWEQWVDVSILVSKSEALNKLNQISSLKPIQYLPAWSHPISIESYPDSVSQKWILSGSSKCNKKKLFRYFVYILIFSFPNSFASTPKSVYYGGYICVLWQFSFAKIRISELRQERNEAELLAEEPTHPWFWLGSQKFPQRSPGMTFYGGI